MCSLDALSEGQSGHSLIMREGRKRGWTGMKRGGVRLVVPPCDELTQFIMRRSLAASSRASSLPCTERSGQNGSWHRYLAPLRQRRKLGHSTFLIDLGSELTEWCRRELGPAGFETVHAGFQSGDVRFQGVDALVELGKSETQKGPHFFELVTNLHAVFLQLMSNSGVTFRDLANVASEPFGHYAKMTFDLFHLLGVHGSLV